MPHGPHGGFGFGGPHIMMGPHHFGPHHMGIGIIPPPVVIGGPLYGPPPPPPLYGPRYRYGYGPGYYDNGEVVCCCGIF